MFMNVGFVAREYTQDDEVTASELEDQFGGDSYCVSKNALFLGLSRNDDGCEPLDCSEQKPDDILDDDEDCRDDYDEDYEHYRSLEDADVRVAEAVSDALQLQKFFRLRKEQEKYEECVTDEELRKFWDEYDARLEAEDKLRAVTCRLNASAQIANRDVEVVETMVHLPGRFSESGSNRKMTRRIKHRRVQKTREVRWEWSDELRRMLPLAQPRLETWMGTEFVRYYWSMAQRCHGGTDNRRYRRGDVSGKMIGTNHRRRHHRSDISRVEFRPVAIFLDTPDGIRRLRVA